MAPKYYTKAINKFRETKGLGRKLKGMLAASSRIAPSQTSRNNSDYRLRLDSGELIGTKLNVYLQVNAQPTSTLFKEWLKRRVTHANLAVAVFDTAAADEKAEKERLIDELDQKGNKALSEL